MKHVHVHVHGAIESFKQQPHLRVGNNERLARRVVNDDAEGIKRDQMGKFATSSGTGEQHAATSELHTSLAARKGTDHPHHPLHMAAAEAHKQAATFLSQANKAQHTGAAVEAERHAKIARTHENVINKGRGSDPKGEAGRQNKAMSDPGVAKGNKERMGELESKYPGKGKPKKTKDHLIKSAGKEAVGENIKTEMKAGKPQKQAIAIALSTQRRSADEGVDTDDCGCGGEHKHLDKGKGKLTGPPVKDAGLDPIDQDTNLPDYTADAVLFSDCSGWTDTHTADAAK